MVVSSVISMNEILLEILQELNYTGQELKIMILIFV